MRWANLQSSDGELVLMELRPNQIFGPLPVFIRLEVQTFDAPGQQVGVMAARASGFDLPGTDRSI